MFALGSWHTRQLTTKLTFLDAIGSDPTKPRKIPGRSTARLLLRMASCVGLAIFSLPEPRRKLQLRNFKQDLILFAHAHLAPARSLLNFACFPLSLLFFPRSSVGAQSPTQCTQVLTRRSRATFSSTLRTAGRFTTRAMEAPT